MPNAALQWLSAACTSETGATQSIGKEMILIWLASASLLCGKAKTFNSTLDLSWPLFRLFGSIQLKMYSGNICQPLTEKSGSLQTAHTDESCYQTKI